MTFAPGDQVVLKDSHYYGRRVWIILRRSSLSPCEWRVRSVITGGETLFQEEDLQHLNGLDQMLLLV